LLKRWKRGSARKLDPLKLGVLMPELLMLGTFMLEMIEPPAVGAVRMITVGARGATERLPPRICACEVDVTAASAATAMAAVTDMPAIRRKSRERMV
jgi:hypothetical protein